MYTYVCDIFVCFRSYLVVRSLLPKTLRTSTQGRGRPAPVVEVWARSDHCSSRGVRSKRFFIRRERIRRFRGVFVQRNFMFIVYTILFFFRRDHDPETSDSSSNSSSSIGSSSSSSSAQSMLQPTALVRLALSSITVSCRSELSASYGVFQSWLPSWCVCSSGHSALFPTLWDR